MGRSWVIAVKDIRQRLRDRSAYVIGIVVPMAMALLLGMAGPQEDVVFTFALVDEDGGAAAEGFADILTGLELEGVADITRTSASTANQMVDDGEVSAAFIVPSGFSEAVMASAPAQLTVVANPFDEVGTQWATGVAQSYASAIDAGNVTIGTVAVFQGDAADAAAATALAERAAAGDQPSRLIRTEEGGAGIDFTTNISFGMAVFFLFFTVQFGVLGLIDERTGGTMTRLLGAPIRPSSILVGKSLAALVIGLASVAVLVLGTSLPPLQTDWGNPVGVAILTVAGVLSAIGLMAVVGGLARTSSDAMGYMTFVAVVLGILGGSFGFIPTSGLIGLLSRLTPHRWLMEGYRMLSVGQPLSELLPAIGVLLAFAAVTGGAGLLLFRTGVGAT